MTSMNELTSFVPLCWVKHGSPMVIDLAGGDSQRRGAFKRE